MLVIHVILKLQFDENDNEVAFQLAKSFHNDTVLALQYDPYWVNMSSYVDLDNEIVRLIAPPDLTVILQRATSSLRLKDDDAGK